ncbi:TPA: hypothetical protein DEO28_02610 [Candidatus Dependentiae bacterium]|nr:MAG: hypothetical protein UR14_C0005G0121 [candidate division TM6 bacterium GW2011_GWE2_31_21]KKP53198.1 MAG: hypothetical protein UR43_C0007G0122 [candidate division TM6 bacterium GW2011_GWF2_33_332]HBS48016.1 hypothetical protein [Candidatus Dependentiae bacterium]HBZ73380.1 hypothetical protein [Candidatus Dependentiae bacterium]
MKLNFKLAFIFAVSVAPILKGQLSLDHANFVNQNRLPQETLSKADKIFAQKELLMELTSKAKEFSNSNLNFSPKNSLLKEELLKLKIIKTKNVHDHIQIICRHSDLPGFILKMALSTSTNASANNRNISRVVGVNLISDYIKRKNFKHVMVPKKYLYHLPTHSEDLNDDNYVVFAEELQILSDGESETLFSQIDRHALKELKEIIKKFGYKDFSFDNIRITSNGGKITIIDTEQFKGFDTSDTTKWNNSPFLQKIDGLMGAAKMDMYLAKDTKENPATPSEHPSIPKPNVAKVLTKLFSPGWL